MSLVANIRALFPQPSANGHKTPGEGDFWAPFRGSGLGYAQAALVRECEEVERAPRGQRNHALNSAAFSLGQLVAGGELGRDEVEKALTEVAGRAGLGALETQRTIASGLKSGALQPRTAPAPALLLPVGVTKPVVVAVVETVEEPTEAEQVHEHLPVLDWHALWEDDTTEDWIVEPLLPARRLIALYSPPKLGKSLLMLELAVGVSLGGWVLGVAVDRPRRVLYVDFENDPKGDVRERLMAMGYGPGDLDGLKYLSFPALAALDSAAGGQQLMAAVRTYQCEVVVIDTVSRAIQGEENENDTWLNFYRHTGKALKAAGVALVRLDHTGKDETRGQRGGSAKSGDVDAVWRMSEVLPGRTYRL
ncbi:MAG TPA: AAA family ATPase, partial [Sporichthya sp.]|nr:AAA family ATPase [Sporichthya sp.]